MKVRLALFCFASSVIDAGMTGACVAEGVEPAGTALLLIATLFTFCVGVLLVCQHDPDTAALREFISAYKIWKDATEKRCRLLAHARLRTRCCFRTAPLSTPSRGTSNQSPDADQPSHRR